MFKRFEAIVLFYTIDRNLSGKVAALEFTVHHIVFWFRITVDEILH